MKSTFKIILIALVTAILPVTALAQTKPRITSPSNNSSSVLGNDVNVYVSGSNIEVIYAGLTGNPNPYNESESNFYKGTMYQSGNKFFFTPNTSTWENKWVKIIAHDKVGGGWSDPVYVKINPKPQSGPVINSFSANKSEYNVGENVSFSGSASNIGSWKVIWLKNGYEADAATGIQHNSNISCGGTVNNTAYNGAILYVYPQANGGGTPVTRRVNFMVKQSTPVINSFSANKSEYNVGENVSFSGSALNFGSWKIVWLKNGREADAVTSIQQGSNISANGTVTSTEYNGAILYVYPLANGGGTPITKKVSFGVVAPPPQAKPTISSFSINKSTYNVGETVVFKGSASNFGSWKVVWLRNGNEVDAVTSIQHNNNISCSGTINNVEYKGAVLYVYPQANGGGTPIKKEVRFGTAPPLLQIPQNGGFWSDGSKQNKLFIPINDAKDMIDAARQKIADRREEWWRDVSKDILMYDVKEKSQDYVIAKWGSKALFGVTLLEAIMCYEAYDKAQKVYTYVDIKLDKKMAEKFIEIANRNSSGYILCEYEGNLVNPGFTPQYYSSNTEALDYSGYLQQKYGKQIIPLNEMQQSDVNKANYVFDDFFATEVINKHSQSIKPSSNSITPVNQPQTYNAQNYTRIGNAALRSGQGHNYIGDINASNGFRFTVNSNNARTATFSIVYSTDPNRGGRLIVNGTTQNIIFDRTGWGVWRTKEVQVQLRQGANTIEFYGGYQTEWAPDIAEITIK